MALVVLIAELFGIQLLDLAIHTEFLTSWIMVAKVIVLHLLLLVFQLYIHSIYEVVSVV